MIKVKSGILIVALILFFSLGLNLSSYALTIAVVKTQDIEAYNLALDGFKEALSGKGVEVWMAGDLGGAKNLSYSVIDSIKAKSPALILALGSAATTAVQKEFPDVPVVFSMVLNPVASGFIKSTHSSGNNLTGASLDIPVETQFRELLSVLPRVKRIGVIYNLEENREIINEASLIAKGMGLELVTAVVGSEKAVPEALDDLIKKVDALWSVSDNIVFTSQSIQYILLNTLRNQMPFMGISPSYVKAGALMALSCDYKDVGHQAGEVAIRVIGGEQPNNIPITAPRKVYLSLNSIVAEQIRINIPSDVVAKAKEVFK
jgi:putative ABC transport system substrate-binding protein